MADFLNIKDLPVKDSFEDGDTILVLSEGKLYQCPEGGGGGGVFSCDLTVPCEYDDHDSDWYIQDIAFVPDDDLEALYAAATAGLNIVIKTHFVDEDTGDLISEGIISSAAFAPVDPEYGAEMIGIEATAVYFGYIGAVVLDGEVTGMEGILLLPESIGGMLG